MQSSRYRSNKQIAKFAKYDEKNALKVDNSILQVDENLEFPFFKTNRLATLI